MNSKLMFSKESDEWETPRDLFDQLNQEFDFEWDAAATAENAKLLGFDGHHYFGLDQKIRKYRDALVADWAATGCSSFWLNPPYSMCREFIAKASWEAARGCTTVTLIPSRTDTRWWHEHIWDVSRNAFRPGVEVRFLKGRLKFGLPGKPATNSAPFPSAIVVFNAV